MKLRKRYTVVCRWEETPLNKITITREKGFTNLKEAYQVLDCIRQVPVEDCWIFIRFYTIFGSEYDADFNITIKLDKETIKDIWNGKNIPLYLNILQEINENYNRE